MEYLVAVFSETVRIYPGDPALDRLCVKNFELSLTLIGMTQLIIKQEHMAYLYRFMNFIMILNISKNQRRFFNPERFFDEWKKDSLTANIPFNLGSRMYISNIFALLETKVLFHLFACCELKICEKMSLLLKLAKDGFEKWRLKEVFDKIHMISRKNMHHTIAANNRIPT